MNKAQVFSTHLESGDVQVRSVELQPGDSVQSRREKLAKIVLDDMYQFVALLDAQGNLLEVNRAALEGGGIRIEEIQGKPFWEAHWWTISRETQERLKEEIHRAGAGEFVRYDVEVFGGSEGHETIVIDFSIIPVRDAQGRVVFLLPEGRNITEKKRVEAEIAKKNQELQLLLDRVRELDELKSQFFANVSHELRTPLALILGPSEKILSEGAYLKNSHRRDLEVIRRNASTLLKQVNDLLDLSKLDAGRMTPRYQETDLARLVRLVASHFDALAPQRGIRFSVHTPPSLAAQVDADKIERVALNLLSNAFKFTPGGGEIRVQLERLPGPSRTARFSVQDNGPGIKDEAKKLIFERFRQADGGATREFGGTGLGLSIAHDFVTLHGGTLSVADAEGGGALFQVELPIDAPADVHVMTSRGAAARHPEASASPAAITASAALRGTMAELERGRSSINDSRVADGPSSEPGATGRLRALVVEDHPEMNRFLVETLSPEFETRSAFDGQTGLELASQLEPDIIVSDIMMPKLSGDRMIERLREDPRFDETPILVLSAKADENLRLKLLESSAQDYLMKPFSAAELIARCRNLAGAKKAKEALRASSETLERAVGERTRALRESEERFRTLANSIPQLTWMADPEGSIFWYNERWYEYTGTTLEEMRGWGWQKAHHPDHVARVVSRMQLSWETGEPWEDLFPLRSRTGEWRWFLSRALPIRDHDGKITRWFGSNTDVTERLDAERKLAETSSLLQTITNSIEDPIYAKDGAGRMIFANPATERVIGKPASELLGKNELEWLGDTPTARAIIENDRRIMASGRGETVEERLETNLGISTFLGTKSPLRGAQGEVVGLVGISRDITEQMRAQAELQESEEKHRSLFSNMTEEVHHWRLVRDRSGTIQTWKLIDANPPALKTWGKSREEVLDKSPDEIFGPGSTARLLPAVRRIFSEGRPHAYEDYLPTLERYFRFTIIPVGERFFSTGADITDIKRSAEQLERLVRERTQALENTQARLLQSSKMSALGEMAGGIAHEINTPLASITMRAQQLERLARNPQPIASEAVQKASRAISEIALRIGSIIKGLRSFAREGSHDPFEWVQAHQLVDNVLSLCQSRFAHHGVVIRYAPAATSIGLECRAVRVEQVLVNLLSNAFDAVQPLPEKWVEIALRSAGDFIEFSVTDSGRGIPEEIVAKLMQPFFTTKAVGKGTGLGLSIARGIVEEHQGRLSLDSDSLHTRFVMRLPVRQHHACKPASSEDLR